MTRSEIIAELRRSATEDADPWKDVGGVAFLEQFHWRTWLTTEKAAWEGDRKSHLRTYFLFVACALESE